MIHRTDVQMDLAAARQVLDDVYPLIGKECELSVTCRPNAKDELRDIGWLPEGEKEGNYSVVTTPFRGTAIETMLQNLPFRYGRTRILKMPGKTCLSIHNDPTVRYHYALVTNPDCYILFKNEEAGTFYHIPADGYLYEMDARKTHTAINASREERIHLVICSAED